MTDREAEPQEAKQFLVQPGRVPVGHPTTVPLRLRPEAAEDFFVEWQQPVAREHRADRVNAG